MPSLFTLGRGKVVVEGAVEVVVWLLPQAASKLETKTIAVSVAVTVLVLTLDFIGFHFLCLYRQRLGRVLTLLVFQTKL